MEIPSSITSASTQKGRFPGQALSALEEKAPKLSSVVHFGAHHEEATCPLQEKYTLLNDCQQIIGPSLPLCHKL